MKGRRGKKRPQATRRREPKRISISWKRLVGDGGVRSEKMPWRILGWLVFVLMPVVLGVTAFSWIQNPNNLTITSIDVSGDFQVLNKAQLAPVIQPSTKTNLYLLDAETLEAAIESNTWVNSASMTKVWPDKLIIKIFEQKPVAFWGDDKMLADNGEIIDGVLKGKIGLLPTLYSPRGEGRDMATSFLKVHKWLKGFPLKIVAFKEDTRGAWQLELKNGITLKIGRNEQKKRLRRFMVGYEQSLSGVMNKIHSVDLRYTNGFAVQWKKGLSADSVFDVSGKKKG